ncbi:uncharacterized protein LOC143081795 [Mytilus galloprovincialis]|uniref:uncharacterized protein LOC143081795 n=1 Tax=Mytilus galloprovincialis TaxID=29158 RepID=UPI003F7CCDA9
MDKATVKVLSWIGFSSVVIYRHYFMKISDDKGTFTEFKGEDKDTLTERVTKDKGTLTEFIREDKGTTTELACKNEATLTEWKGNYCCVSTFMRPLFEPGQPSAVNMTPKTVVLTWDAPHAGTQFVHHYEIHCKERQMSESDCFRSSGNSNKYIVHGLKENTEYEFTVQAIKVKGTKGPCSKAIKISTTTSSHNSMEGIGYFRFSFILQKFG